MGVGIEDRVYVSGIICGGWNIGKFGFWGLGGGGWVEVFIYLLYA